MKLGYVIVYTPNVPAALSFYERAFGLTRRFLHESNDYGELDTGATVLGFADDKLAVANGLLFLINCDGTIGTFDPTSGEAHVLTTSTVTAYGADAL